MASESTLTGQVKWFNTKTGFGFLTVKSEGEHQGQDIFVHHSDLSVEGDQYRYLVMGEYVEFGLKQTDDEHKVKATDVQGIMGGSLMCKVRFENSMRGDDEGREQRPVRRGGHRGGHGSGRRQASGRPRRQDSAPAQE